MHLSEVKISMSMDCGRCAAGYNIESTSGDMTHGRMLFAILRKVAEYKARILPGGGVLEVLPDGFWFLRSWKDS